MGCHLIGIGGTGAKTIEAVTRLCAAGRGPQALSVIFLDPDTANGNIERSREAFEAYRTCRTAQNGATWGDAGLLRTALSGGEVVTPFEDDVAPTLGGWLQYDVLQQQRPEIADLIDVLYTDEEKIARLEKGFRGHPSIGSAVMAGQVSFQRTLQFQQLKNEVDQDVGNGETATIVLVGSIFGGTGAAGFPTVARMLREEFAAHAGGAVQLGGVLVLPYFSFARDGQSDEMAAKSSEFLLSTQAALEFYDQSEYEQLYDRLYILGDSQQSPVGTFALGAGEQRNDPHFIELYAALAALDMFTGEPQDAVRKVSMLARREARDIEWADLPDGAEVKEALGQLIRFSVAFTRFYHPLISDIRQNGSSHRAAWYADLIQKASVSPDDEPTTKVLRRLDAVCLGVLDWTERLHKSSGDQRNVDLFDCLTFEPGDDATQFDPPRFSGIVRPDTSTQHTMTAVWDRLCRQKYAPASTGTNGIGVFLRALYDACGTSV